MIFDGDAIKLMPLQSFEAGGVIAEIDSVQWFIPRQDNVHEDAAADVIIVSGLGSANERCYRMRFWNARFLSFDPYASWFADGVPELLSKKIPSNEILLGQIHKSPLLEWWQSRDTATSNPALSFDCGHYVISDGTSLAHVLAFAPPDTEEVSHAH